MLFEFLAALGAADHDFAFSLRNADLLTALGAFINMEALVAFFYVGIPFQPEGKIPDLHTERAEPSADGAAKAAAAKLRGELHIFPVLVVAFGDVSGEHAEIHINQKNQRDPPENGEPQNQIQNDQDQNHNGEKLPEFVRAVAALHELHHFIPEAIKHSKTSFQTIYFYCKFHKVNCNEGSQKESKKNLKHCRKNG